MKKKINFKKLLAEPMTGEELFHQNTEISSDPVVLPKSLWPKEWKIKIYKSYGRFKEVKLPRPTKMKGLLQTALKNRISARTFKRNKLSIKKLSEILYFSAGEMEDGRRPYPSSGALYPLEIYILAKKTLQPGGVYHYYVPNNSLEAMFVHKKVDFEKLFFQKWVDKCSLVIVITLNENRILKYGDRGYRYALLEAGHLAQNFSLVANSIGMSSCCIGNFNDRELANLMEIDKIREKPIYCIAF